MITQNNKIAHDTFLYHQGRMGSFFWQDSFLWGNFWYEKECLKIIVKIIENKKLDEKEVLKRTEKDIQKNKRLFL